MDDINDNFVTECLIKVQTFFFESICGKGRLDGWIKLTEKNYGVYCINTSKVSECCRCSLPS